MKNTITILFFAGLMIIGGLNVDKEALARGYKDYDCDLCKIRSIAEDYSCQNFNFDLTAVERVPGADGLFDYTYAVSGTANCPISKIDLLELGIEGTLVATGAISVAKPGQGGFGPDDWLQGVPQLQVLNVNDQAVSFIIRVSGTNGMVGKIAAHTMANKQYETCFIDGPISSLVPVDASIPLTKQVVLNGYEYCIAIDPRTGCPDPEKAINLCEEQSCGDNPLPPCNLVWDETFKIGQDTLEETPTFIGSTGEVCSIIKAAHNPCQWVILSGKAYGPVCW